MNQRGSMLVYIIIALVVISILIGGSYLLLKQTPENSTPTTQSTPTPKPVVKPTTNTTESSNTVEELSKKCTNENLQISLMLPENWKCNSENLVGGEGAISIKSSFFEITISTLGRGPYCNTSDPKCVSSEFYSNDNLTTQLWSVDNEDKEIFGSITGISPKTAKVMPWISIKYKNMNTNKLTAVQKSTLTQILDSIQQL